MKKGDIVVISPTGEFGKPRPAVVIQDTEINEIDSVIVCLMTSTIKNSVLRVTIEPSANTGLQKVSQVMTDKLMTQKKAKIGEDDCAGLEAGEIRENKGGSAKESGNV